MGRFDSGDLHLRLDPRARFDAPSRNLKRRSTRSGGASCPACRSNQERQPARWRSIAACSRRPSPTHSWRLNSPAPLACHARLQQHALLLLLPEGLVLHPGSLDLTQQRVVGPPATQVVGQQRAGRGLELGLLGHTRRPGPGAIESDPLVDRDELVLDPPYFALPICRFIALPSNGHSHQSPYRLRGRASATPGRKSVAGRATRGHAAPGSDHRRRGGAIIVMVMVFRGRSRPLGAQSRRSPLPPRPRCRR